MHENIPPAAPVVVQGYTYPLQAQNNLSGYGNQSAGAERSPEEDAQMWGKWQILEERLRAVEGSNYGIGEASDLCLVPNVVIPPKFKVPEFDKYKGTSCPRNHLVM